MLRLGLFSYWINTYTGGAAIAALGGALVLGAFPRLMKDVRIRDGVLLALGIVVLAISRPYEGLLLCLPVAVVLGRWILSGKNRPAPAVLIRRAALPLVVLVAGAAWMADYDYRAFGSPLTLPYTINRATYAVAPYWIWQSPRPEPAYRHPVMRDFYVKQELPVVTNFHTAAGFVVQNIFKPVNLLRFYAGIALLTPLLMLRRTLHDKRTRFLRSGRACLDGRNVYRVSLTSPLCRTVYGGVLCHRPSVHASLARLGPGGQARLVWESCARLSSLVLRWRRCGRGRNRSICSLPNWPPSAWTANWYGPGELGAPRARILAGLEQQPGKQLVIVRYSQDHNPVWEWVYNEADIENSKVIWAREMDAANNLDLIRYYKDRKVWLVQPDMNPVSVSPDPLP